MADNESSVPPPVEPAAPVTPVSPIAIGANSAADFQAAVHAGWAGLSAFERKVFLVAGGGWVLVVLSTLMPWISIFTGSVSGISTNWGKIIALVSLAAAVSLVLIVAKKVPAQMVLLGQVGLAAAIAFGLLVFIIRLGHAVSGGVDEKDNPFAAMLSTQVGAGFGAYLGILAGLGAMAAAAVLVCPELGKVKFTGKSLPAYIAAGAGALVGAIVVLV